MWICAGVLWKPTLTDDLPFWDFALYVYCAQQTENDEKSNTEK